MNRKLSHRRYEQLKATGADLIEDYALAYPLDPFEIAGLLGVDVTVHHRGLPPAARSCATTDGYTEPVQSAHGPKFQAHLNGALPPLRQRFTLMHETAHVWLDHPRQGGSVTDEVAEAEANFLAGYLLAPDALVLTWVPELTVAGIAGEFQVSGESARLIHGRVMRMLNANASGREYDRRIEASARRRVGCAGAAPGLRGSA